MLQPAVHVRVPQERPLRIDRTDFLPWLGFVGFMLLWMAVGAWVNNHALVRDLRWMQQNAIHASMPYSQLQYGTVDDIVTSAEVCMWTPGWQHGDEQSGGGPVVCSDYPTEQIGKKFDWTKQ